MFFRTHWMSCLLVVAGSSCDSSGGASAPSTESPTSAVEPPAEHVPEACVNVDTSDALAVFDGRPCAWVLGRGVEGGTLELQEARADAPPMRGEAPEPCRVRPCRYRGADTTLGPMLVVEGEAARSEVPSGLWLGVVKAEQLEFIDLWDGAGPPVEDAGITVGPAYSLVPHACDGVLTLRAQPRIPGAQIHPPPASLSAREGAVSSDSADVDVRPGVCERLHLALP